MHEALLTCNGLDLQRTWQVDDNSNARSGNWINLDNNRVPSAMLRLRCAAQQQVDEKLHERQRKLRRFDRVRSC